MIKNLIIINVAVYLLQLLATSQLGQPIMEQWFSLHYMQVMYGYRFWQPFTYMFLHGSLMHLLFNMLALYFIGMEIERFWGSKRFLTFYLTTGFGAGLFIFALDSLKIMFNVNGLASLGSTLGASGAIFGLLFLYSILFKERQISILVFFIIPITIKAKNLIWVSLGLTVVFSMFMSGGNQISHTGHFGGVLSAMLFLFLFRKHHNYIMAYGDFLEWKNHLFNLIKKPKMGNFKSSAKSSFRNSGFDRSSRIFDKAQVDLDETKMTEYQIETKIDDLLDIIAIKGLKSLTVEERNFLERVSIIYRHKFPE